MTLQQLRYFLAAADHGSFSAAAESLLMAQPSLSEQIRRLEAELGVALFARAGRRLALTEAGRMLRPHAERTLAAAEEAADVGQGGPHAHRRDGELRHVRQRAPLPARRAGAGLPPAPSRRARARRRPELGRGGRRRARGQPRGRARRAARRRPRARGPPVDPRGGPLRQREPAAHGGAEDDRGDRGRAADPLRRALGRRRPDAPPARRARAARRRADRARDRGRVPHRGARPRRAPARRHDRRARACS